MAATEQNMAGLLTLPVETRLKIYHLCFAWKEFESDVDWVKVDIRFGRYLVKPYTWPLFQVCKQIYAEVMPEYYASTEFHFTALVHLRQTITSQPTFTTYARHIILNPQFDIPTAEELLVFTNLQTFAVASIACHEPIGTPRGHALEKATLKSVLDATASRVGNNQTANKAMRLQEDMARIANLCKRDVHILLRFRYSYVEKAKHPDGWGGATAKRHRIINYDCADDAFIISRPEKGEARRIRSVAY